MEDPIGDGRGRQREDAGEGDVERVGDGRADVQAPVDGEAQEGCQDEQEEAERGQGEDQGLEACEGEEELDRPEKEKRGQAHDRGDGVDGGQVGVSDQLLQQDQQEGEAEGRQERIKVAQEVEHFGGNEGVGMGGRRGGLVGAEGE